LLQFHSCSQSCHDIAEIPDSSNDIAEISVASASSLHTPPEQLLLVHAIQDGKHLCVWQLHPSHSN
jgi:hypothetical protein